MIQPLTPRQAQWVDDTLDALSLESCVAQMLEVSRIRGGAAEWFQFIDRIPMGCMGARSETAEAHHDLLTEIQGYSPIPVLVLANMEHGAADWPGYGTDFPPPMSLGAAGDDALAADAQVAPGDPEFMRHPAEHEERPVDAGVREQRDRRSGGGVEEAGGVFGSLVSERVDLGRRLPQLKQVVQLVRVALQVIQLTRGRAVIDCQLVPAVVEHVGVAGVRRGRSRVFE